MLTGIITILALLTLAALTDYLYAIAEVERDPLRD